MGVYYSGLCTTRLHGTCRRELLVDRSWSKKTSGTVHAALEFVLQNGYNLLVGVDGARRNRKTWNKCSLLFVESDGGV
jgi:hypothetical protein